MIKKVGTYVFASSPPQTIAITPNLNISVVTNHTDFRKFYRIPWTVYAKNQYWVPPLWNEQRDFFKRANPFWTHAETQLFVATQGTSAVGRITAIIDHKFPKEKGKTIGYFGFFESMNDPSVATALLTAAQDWLASKGAAIMRGPINGRIDGECGFLLEGFDKIPFMITTYSPKYYLEFAETFGMKKARDLVAYQIDLTQPIPTAVQETAQQCEKSGVHVRPFNRVQFQQEMTWWSAFLLEEFTDHWGYTPATQEEIQSRFGMRQLRWIIKPRLFLIAEIENEPIGFRWSLPNYNPIIKQLNGKVGVTGILRFLWNARRIQQGKFIIMGIRKQYRGQGIGTCMNYHTLREMKQLGYTTAEYGWIEEHNIASRKAGEKIGGQLYKKYRVYEKPI